MYFKFNLYPGELKYWS